MWYVCKRLLLEFRWLRMQLLSDVMARQMDKVQIVTFLFFVVIWLLWRERRWQKPESTSPGRSNPGSTRPERGHNQAPTRSAIDFVLTSVVKLRMKRFSNPTFQNSFDVEKLQDPTVAELIKIKVGGEFSTLDLLGSDVKPSLETSKWCFGQQPNSVRTSEYEKNKPRSGHERHPRCPCPKEGLSERKKIPTWSSFYKELNCVIRKRMKEATEKENEGQCRIIEEIMTENRLCSY